jgi:hypothetical protein
MYVRVPTWLPCRLQICFNAHHWLAARLRKEGVPFEMEDNAFVRIGDWKRAQELAARFCPVVEKFSRGYPPEMLRFLRRIKKARG